MTSWEAALPVFHDEKWLVHHFEKMLYDNALLVIVSARPISFTRKEVTGDYPANHGIHPPGTIGRERGLLSALDPMRRGGGRYYVWDKSEDRGHPRGGCRCFQ